MLLAGVVMKLGAYGCLRVAMVLFPDGVRMWQNEIAALAVIGIVYGAGVALVQRDFKFVIGYSSVSHMGFVLLGLATLNTIGLSGAVLQMFSHGIIAGLLFAVVGRMVYDRTHTRDFNDLQTMQLGKLLPFAGVTFVLAGVASMGLPGFSGFVAELQVLMGAWKVFPMTTILAGVGHRRGRGLHPARDAKGVLFGRAGAGQIRPRPSVGTHFHAGTHRGGDAHCRVAGHRTFPGTCC